MEEREREREREREKGKGGGFEEGVHRERASPSLMQNLWTTFCSYLSSG